MRVAWLTDIHLNFLSPLAVEQFCDRVAAERFDAVLIGGDIAEASDLIGYLNILHDRLHTPLYFVLGNHDFYHGGIRAVRLRARKWQTGHATSKYLTCQGVCELTPQVGLIGHDGWADARAGRYETSPVMLNDYVLIRELAGLEPDERKRTLMELGDEAAAHVRRVLPEALAEYERVMFLTHVPPLRGACWYQGRTSDDDWAPHFVCEAVGEALLNIMSAHPEKQLTVLCGHTHGAGECRPLANVHILTGGATYGEPAISRVWEL